MSNNEETLKKLREENYKLTQQVGTLKATLNHVGAYIYTKDIEGRYTFVNSMVSELFDLPPEEIIGKDDSHFFSLDESDDVKRNDQKVMSKGVIIKVEEKNIITSTGETRYYMTVKSPTYDCSNKITGMLGVSTDITTRKKMENELRESRDLLSTIFNNIDACIYLKDKDYRFSYVNPKTEEVFGLNLNQIVGKKGNEILPTEVAELFHITDKKVFDEKIAQYEEEHIQLEDGSFRSYWSMKIPLIEESGEVNKLIGVSTEITELTLLRKELENKVNHEISQRLAQEKLAITDPLTGLFNRLKLDSLLKNELERLRRHSGELGIMLIDIDDFKKVNDSYGHQAGDELLIAFSNVIKKNIRKTDSPGRWGGEEFLILCPGTSEVGLEQLAEKLRSEIEQEAFKDLKPITASIGISSFKERDTLKDIISRADKALYRAKEKGKNKVEK